MRLRFPAPIGDRLHAEAVVAVAGLELRVIADEPLPDDRDAWRSRFAEAGSTLERVETPTGWPLAIVRGDGALRGCYELLDRGVVVEITSHAPLDVVAARALLVEADLDRTPRELVALAQLWDEP